jgi:hypothetical protein
VAGVVLVLVAAGVMELDGWLDARNASPDSQLLGSLAQ